MSSGLLSGIKVVDATSNVLGPYCTQMLAEFGADVVKVEAPAGDFARLIGPHADTGLSASFYALNRGKRSVGMNLRDERAKPALHRLIQSADVFVHNMRPDAARKLGLDYPSLSAVKPALVYCQATGYGTDGPYQGAPAYDDIIQASSGAAWLQSDSTGAPRYVTTVLADKLTGLLSLSAILAGLTALQRTGQGCELEVPMFESMVSFLLIEQMGGMSWEPPKGPPVYGRTMLPNRRPYPTSDGYVSVMPYTDRHWSALFAEIGRPELESDPRFSSTVTRSANIDAAYGVMADALPARSTDEWIQTFKRLDIPSARVNSIADLFADEHLEAVGMFGLEEHPEHGQMRFARSPIKINGTHLEGVGPSPALGQDTRTVLAEAGCDAELIETLIGAGVVVDGSRHERR